ncbi:MAG TPA: TIGR00341 family protein, partial [Methanothrix sp.]|nr:TIGR00341 family protein [Methanothrix sp.]
ALKTLFLGIGLAIILSIALGFLLPVDPALREISSRTSVGLMEIVLALASGAAGALSFTSAAPAVLIGVAVAVALMPPLVVSGLLLGAGEYTLALGAFFLFLANFISVNLAGVVTFLAQGIEPRTWWEARNAKKATILAIVGWIIMLAILIIVIFLGDHQLLKP